MIKLSYSIPVKTSYEVALRFRDELYELWAPLVFFRLVRALFIIGLGGLVFYAVPDIRLAVATLVAGFFMFWAFHVTMQKLVSRYFVKFLKRLPVNEAYVTQIDDASLVIDQGGIKTSYPLSMLSCVFVEDDAVFIHFGIFQKIRIPPSAFDTPAAREDLVALLKKHLAAQPSQPALLK